MPGARLGPWIALLLAASACDGGARDRASARPDPPTAADSADSAAPADADVVPEPVGPLRDEAEAILAFLRGKASLDVELLADTVTLLIAPEGGGERRRVPGRELRDREAWRVGRFTLLPPAELTRRVIRPGRHLNCMELPLASRFPELAALPHVGVGLAAPEPGSCLQTWNVTLVFEPARIEGPGHPRLTAVVYDQWEW